MINLSITGDTEQEIDRLAQAAGVTPGQWLRLAIAAAIEFRAIERPRVSDLGKALSSFVACQDPLCPDAWAEHEQHGQSQDAQTRRPIDDYVDYLHWSRGQRQAS